MTVAGSLAAPIRSLYVQITNYSQGPPQQIVLGGGTQPMQQQPPPGSSNGTPAALYRDLTWGTTAGVSLADGTNWFQLNMVSLSGVYTYPTVTQMLPVTVSFTYDDNRNLLSDGTRNFTYDDANRLIEIYVTNSWNNWRSTYAYDGLSRRRIRQDYTRQGSNWVLNNETRYLYAGSTVIQERNSINQPTVTYTRGNGLLARTDTNGTCYYHVDGNHNVTALVNSQGTLVARYIYDPYGNLLESWGSMADANRYRFASQEVHPLSGLYAYPFRFYDPNLGRWINRDPIGFLGGRNPFAFVGNNPISRIDPFGLAANVVSGPNGPVGPSSLDAPGGARYVPGSLPPLPLPGYLFGGVVVGMAGAAAVTIGAPLAVSGLTLAGMSTTAAGATVTTGLGALGTAGALASGYDIYNNACKKNWNGIAFDLGTLGGGALVGVAGGGRALAGLSDSPSSVSPGAGLFGDTYLHYDPNYPGGSFLGWLGSAPTPQSGGAVLTFTAGGAGFLFQPSPASGGK